MSQTQRKDFCPTNQDDDDESFIAPKMTQTQTQTGPSQVDNDTNFSKQQHNTSFTSQASRARSALAAASSVPLIGWFILITAALGGSSIGVLANLIPAQGSFVKAAWRNAQIVIIVAPIALWQYLKMDNKKSLWNLMTMKECASILLQSLLNTLWAYGVMVGTTNLIQSQAYVLCNMHGFFIVLLMTVRGIKISKNECMGMMFATVGCVCLIMDPNAQREEGQQQTFAPWLAAAITFASSITAAAFLMLNSDSASKLPVFFLLMVLQSLNFMISAVLAKIFEPGSEIFSLSTTHGCFGFLNLVDQNPWPVLLYGVLAGFFGLAGYTIALVFFSPLVCSSTFLSEILFAQLEGYFLGIDKWPGILTWLGGSVTIIGLLLIEKGSRARKDSQNMSLNDSFQSINVTKSKIENYETKNSKEMLILKTNISMSGQAS